MSKTNIIFDLNSYTYFDLLGADSEKLLQGQISVDVTKILPYIAQLAVLCNPKGRIVSLFHIHRITNGFRFILPKETAEPAITHLKKYAVFYKVSITPSNDPSSLIVMSNDSKDKLNLQTISIPTINLSIIYSECESSMIDLAKSASYEILDNDAQWYWEMANHRIAWLTETSCEQFLPHNLDLPNLSAVDFNKGCFTGQEVIARMQYKGKLKQHLQLLRTKQIVDMPPLEKLFQGDKKVAEVICCISQQGIGSLVLALVKDSADKNRIFLNPELGYELIFD